MKQLIKKKNQEVQIETDKVDGDVTAHLSDEALFFNLETMKVGNKTNVQDFFLLVLFFNFLFSKS